MPNASEYDRENTWTGIYRGKVINARDPDKQGKVKLWIPDIMPEIPDTYGIWARPANNAVGGANTIENTPNGEQLYQGMWMVPALGSYVYIFFEGGDPNQPRYLAAADFGQQNAPIENQQGSEWEKKWTLFKSRQGRIVIISDDSYDERVEITGKKRTIIINDKQSGNPESVYKIETNQSTILIDERTGKEKILIKDHNGNYININTESNKIDIETPDGEINIKAAKTIKITASQNLDIFSSQDVNIKGKNVNIVADENFNSQAGQNVNIKALNGNFNAEASTDANLKAAGGANVQGAEANVRGETLAKFGGGAVEIKGSAVVAIDGSSLSLQNGVATPPGPAGTADSASPASQATPSGDRGGPTATEGNKAITPKDSSNDNEIIVPPLKTIRNTNKPSNKTGSDR